jgi:hypothetical protein
MRTYLFVIIVSTEVLAQLDRSLEAREEHDEHMIIGAEEGVRV